MSDLHPDLLSLENFPIKAGSRVVVIRTDWNAHIVDQLEAGCVEILQQQHVTVEVIRVPGAFEISFAVKHYWETHKYTDAKPAAFIAMGCIIQGDTPHFDYVCRAITDGVRSLNLMLPVPTIFGVLTVDNDQQAMERTGGKHGHKGKEAAATAIRMIHFSENQCVRKPARQF